MCEASQLSTKLLFTQLIYVWSIGYVMHIYIYIVFLLEALFAFWRVATIYLSATTAYTRTAHNHSVVTLATTEREQNLHHAHVTCHHSLWREILKLTKLQLVVFSFMRMLRNHVCTTVKLKWNKAYNTSVRPFWKASVVSIRHSQHNWQWWYSAAWQCNSKIKLYSDNVSILFTNISPKHSTFFRLCM